MESRIQKLANRCKDRFSKVVRLLHSGLKRQSLDYQLDGLPLELLDMILQKSCLHLFLRIDKPENERGKDVIEKLASINFCCFKRVTRRRFKKAISSELSLHYRSVCKRRSIIRNNQRYLLETTQPTVELLEKLQAGKCLTEDQIQSIKKLRTDFDKNWEILQALRPYSEKMCKIFVVCLRHTGQHRVANIIDNGGVVARLTASEAPLIHRLTRKLNEYENEFESKEKSLQTKMRITDDDIEMRPCDRGVVAWIWLKCQRTFMHFQYLIDSNRQKSNFMFETSKKLKISEVCHEVNIDDNIILKEFVCINLREACYEAEFYLPSMYWVNGITKLKNKIYVISYSFNRSSSVIQVFEDRSPFRLLKEFAIKGIKVHRCLCSSEKDNCLYVAGWGYQNNSIWMITRDEDVVRWVELDFSEVNSLSISFDSHLLAASSRGHLSVYDSEKNLVLSTRILDIKTLCYAMETSSGNFIILYQTVKKLETFGENSETRYESRWLVSELSRDGKTFIRHFVPQNEDQEMIAGVNCTNISFNIGQVCIDSGGRVFVMDTWNNRVILLDSDLCWMGILVDERQKRNRGFRRMFFDEKNKQLIIGEYGIIAVYRLY